MSSDIAIKVENLSKCYQIYDTPRDRLKQFVMPRLQRAVGLQPKQHYREFWALRGVSFEVKKGETVGIIGRNGSGKSTLLQMICGTLNPTSGSIQVHGRIAALLELGSGFNPEFTGRENIYLNGAVLGLSKEEIDCRFDEIAAFADIGDFIEQPAKSYSSGMFVRLAFAVNVMSRPEIMVVDEALAVGDMAFQAKCMTALKRIQDNGATVLFVSHDVGSIKSLCNAAVFLEKGALKQFGKASEIAEQYVRVMREEMNRQVQVERSKTTQVTPAAMLETQPDAPSLFKTSTDFENKTMQFRYGKGGARIRFAEMTDLDGNYLAQVEFNQKVAISIYFEAEIDDTISVNYYIQDDKKNLIIGAGLRTTGNSLLDIKKGGKYIVTYYTCMPLHEGNHSIQIQLTRPLVKDQTAEFLDVIDDAVVFVMQRRKSGRIWTKVYLDNNLEIKSL